mmetsp:Transcript_22799/g.74435  ORF Transcript_22799/g.74435 Transcript_22799/m.74435 type:complete len:210 (-) Transcript_22799:802-1431(-)
MSSLSGRKHPRLLGLHPVLEILRDHVRRDINCLPPALAAGRSREGALCSLRGVQLRARGEANNDRRHVVAGNRLRVSHQGSQTRPPPRLADKFPACTLCARVRADDLHGLVLADLSPHARRRDQQEQILRCHRQAGHRLFMEETIGLTAHVLMGAIAAAHLLKDHRVPPFARYVSVQASSLHTKHLLLDVVANNYAIFHLAFKAKVDHL